MGMNRAKSVVNAVDVDAVLLGLNFTINGSNPVKANNLGNEIIGQQVIRNGAGDYTLQLHDTWGNTLSSDINLQLPSFTHFACNTGPIVSGVAGQPAATFAGNFQGGTVRVFISNQSGSLADPANGTVVAVDLMVSQSLRRASQ